MLCVEDALDALAWADTDRRPRRACSAAPTPTWRCSRTGSPRRPGSPSSPRIPATRSNTSVCLKVVDPRVTGLPEAAQADFAKKLASLLEKEGVALDVGGYRDAPPGLRIWCGATVDTSDLDALTPWLDWAFASVAEDLAAA